MTVVWVRFLGDTFTRWMVWRRTIKGSLLYSMFHMGKFFMRRVEILSNNCGNISEE